MAQNYINYFETDSLYNGAKSGLSQPNVSFVKDSGNIHYTKATYGLAASELGDIILEDSTKLYSVSPDVYNLTDFPLATYTPIGVTCISGNDVPDGKHRVFSCKYMEPNNPEIGRVIGTNIIHGKNISYDLTDYPDYYNNTKFNGKEIQNYFMSMQTYDWQGNIISTSSIDGHFPAFCCAARFHTQVTSPGDWYIPSYAEIDAFRNFKNTITNSFSIIKNLGGSSLNEYEFSRNIIWTSTCRNVNDTYVYTYVVSSNYFSSDNRSVGHSVLPMLQIGVEEV